jgi:hypothetical protein
LSPSCLAFLAGFILLAPQTSWAGWTGWTKLQRVYSGYPDGEVYLDLEDEAENPGGCVSNLYRHDTDTEKFLSIALAALLADREISIKVGGCNGSARVAMQIQVH